MSLYETGPTNLRWRMLILVPIWCLQLKFISTYVIVLCILIGITQKGTNEGGSSTDMQPGIQPWTIVNLAIASATLVLTCGEIIMHQFRDLSPGVFLSSSLFKCLLWIGPLVFNIVTTSGNWAMDNYNHLYLDVAIGFAGIGLFTSMISLIYAVVMYHRYRKRMRAVNEKHGSSRGIYRTIG